MLALLIGMRVIYVALLVIAVAWMAPTAMRALTTRSQGSDFHFLLFWGLAFNRLWFVGRAVKFADAPDPGWDFLSLSACYLFAIVIVALVLLAFHWSRQHG